MIRALSHSASQAALAGMVLAVLAGCAREDEAGMRARLAQWFSLGETRGFAARSGCAAGGFKLVEDGIASGLPVVSSVPEMLRMLDRRGRAALDDRGQSPDAALVVLVNADRETGYAMRRAALEARACMDEATGSAFRAGLVSAGAVLAWDGESGMVMVIDRDRMLVIAAMGEA